jgi:hypothetical protein
MLAVVAVVAQLATWGAQAVAVGATAGPVPLTLVAVAVAATLAVVTEAAEALE